MVVMVMVDDHARRVDWPVPQALDSWKNRLEACPETKDKEATLYPRWSYHSCQNHPCRTIDSKPIVTVLLESMEEELFCHYVLLLLTSRAHSEYTIDWLSTSTKAKNLARMPYTLLSVKL